MKTLSWPQLRYLGATDSAGRWYPCADVAEYFSDIRSPSRAWPSSYAKAAQSQRFAKWLRVNHPALADRAGV